MQPESKYLPSNPQGYIPSMAYQPSPQPMVIIQPQSQGALPGQGNASYGRTLPSWNCILVETIIGMVCCCFVLGLIGLIFAIMGNSDNDQKYLRWAHYLGISSIILGVIDYICACIIIVIYFVLFAYVDNFEENKRYLILIILQFFKFIKIQL